MARLQTPANGGGGGGGQGPMGGLRSGTGRLSHLAVVSETDPFRYPGRRRGARLHLGGCARGAGGKAGQVRGPEDSWLGAGPQVRGHGRGGVLAGASSGCWSGGRGLGRASTRQAQGGRAFLGRTKDKSHHTHTSQGARLGTTPQTGSTPIPAIK